VTAAPVATVAPSPTATPSSSPTTTAPAGGGGGFGGGGGGGGFVPPPPVVSPSPSPTISNSPTPLPTVSAIATYSQSPSSTPKPSLSPTATPVATTSATPSSSPSPSPTPSVTRNSKGEVTKTDSFAVLPKTPGSVKVTIISAPSKTIVTSLKSTVQASITVKKGALIKVVVKDASGKSFTIASVTAKSAGTYKTPALKFAKAGIYQVTILIGKVKKVITYKITK
jgi:hypothetical protein